jgi:hypothetical protein
MLAHVVAVEELDAGRAREVLAQHVAGTGLEGPPVAHHGLDGVRVVGAGEGLGRALGAGDDGDGQPFLGHLAVALETGRHLGRRFGFGGVERVGLLPQEFGRPQEEPRAELPADHVVPQVHEQRQVPV